MNIKEFLITLFTHRTIIDTVSDQLLLETDLRMKAEAAVATLAHALVYITTPPPEVDEAPLKPIRLQRRSYSEEARWFERTNSARFRDMDRERAKKAAAVNR